MRPRGGRFGRVGEGGPRAPKTIREPEAVVILECAARLLAGEAIRSLCRDLDEREVPTVSGEPWKLLDPHASLAGLVLVLRVLLQGQDVKVGSHEPS